MWLRKIEKGRRRRTPAGPAGTGRSVPIRMTAHYSQKHDKIWSPNPPFGGGHTVFSGREAASLCARRKARPATLEDAMAALTRRVEPLRWSNGWLRKKFMAMGMPRSNGDVVLLFNSDFIVAVHEKAMDDAALKIVELGEDRMIDAMRGGEGRVGIAVWVNKPSAPSKMPGAPAAKVKCMSIRFRKK